MKIEEAIEELQNTWCSMKPGVEPKRQAALNLGIEALKFCLVARSHTFYVGPELLPGETEN